MGVFASLGNSGHEQVVYCNDSATGLKAIIAIHDTTLGPALGGCRMWNYEDEEQALTDVLRLSRGMTYKAALAGLNLGGGKAVIMGDPEKIKSEALFRTFGRFVDSLSGRYITAQDVNIKVEDIESIATETRFATGLVSRPGGSGDPSPFTALGVYHGIRAAVKHKLGRTSLSGVSIAVQGCGAVGSFLVELLAKDGAVLTIADIDARKVQHLVERFGAKATMADGIHRLPVDVYSPNGLGGVIHNATVNEISAPIVAGGANNQLLDENVHGDALRARNILYCPDYVINAGGLINVCQELVGYNEAAVRAKTGRIYDTLLQVFHAADREGMSTARAANAMAEERIEAVRRTNGLRNGLSSQVWSLIR